MANNITSCLFISYPIIQSILFLCIDHFFTIPSIDMNIFLLLIIPQGSINDYNETVSLAKEAWKVWAQVKFLIS